MKAESLNTIVVAKNLLDRVRSMTISGDAHLCSAGLVILQDSLELIFLGALLELGVDEQKALEKFTFNQLIGELKVNSIKVPKS